MSDLIPICCNQPTRDISTQETATWGELTWQCEKCRKEYSTPLHPPLGLRPASIVDEARVLEILAACTRYAEAHKQIPPGWLHELIERNNGLNL